MIPTRTRIVCARILGNFCHEYWVSFGICRRRRKTLLPFILGGKGKRFLWPIGLIAHAEFLISCWSSDFLNRPAVKAVQSWAAKWWTNAKINHVSDWTNNRYIRVISQGDADAGWGQPKIDHYVGDLTVNPETKYPAWSVWFCCALLTRLCYTSTTCFDLKFKRNGVGRIRKENGPGKSNTCIHLEIKSTITKRISMPWMTDWRCWRCF